MSYLSPTSVMQRLVEDREAPLGRRIVVLNDRSWRPSLACLIRLIKDPSTQPRLRALACVRYKEQSDRKAELKRSRQKNYSLTLRSAV